MEHIDELFNKVKEATDRYHEYLGKKRFIDSFAEGE